MADLLVPLSGYRLVMLENIMKDQGDRASSLPQGSQALSSSAALTPIASELGELSPRRSLKVLLIVNYCNPEWSSVPTIGYRFFHEISKLATVTLVTHDRNRPALEKLQESAEIVYIPEGDWSKNYYKLVDRVLNRKKTNWPLMHAVLYPIYQAFDRDVYDQYSSKIVAGEYDIVHALTPMEPRYPYKIVNACESTPFMLGPVNGGVPYPPGFRKKANAEFAYFNFLRSFGRWLIPNYAQTYKKADRILAGSTYTLNFLKNLFGLGDDRIELFYENGIVDDFLIDRKTIVPKPRINLLFVGRLVPYKSADILIDAVSQLDADVQAKLNVTIVGDGSEKAALEDQVKALGLQDTVTFTGWIKQEETVHYYRNADIFCFPSIREYGGGVVLEAMASGLPCIVTRNGGIGEYVTEETGFRIEPRSREYLTQTFADRIQCLIENPSLRQDMTNSAIERVKEFAWGRKAQAIVDRYYELVAAR